MLVVRSNPIVGVGCGRSLQVWIPVSTRPVDAAPIYVQGHRDPVKDFGRIAKASAVDFSKLVKSGRDDAEPRSEAPFLPHSRYISPLEGLIACCAVLGGELAVRDDYGDDDDDAGF